MFTLRKLQRLPYKTRLRKLVLILQKAEMELHQGHSPDISYIFTLLESVKEHDSFGDLYLDTNREPGEHLRTLNNIRHRILKQLGGEPAEWDFINHKTGDLDDSQRLSFPCKIYLEDIRSPFNVGAIFRSAESFGVSEVLLSPDTPLPSHKKATRTSRGADKIIPWNTKQLEELGTELPVFALETGGQCIDEFPFPDRGIVLIGSEELGLSPGALELADNSAGRVEIPLYGAKRSLNVSVAFGILMQRWCSVLTSGK